MKDLENLTGETLRQHIYIVNRNRAGAMAVCALLCLIAIVFVAAIYSSGEMDTGTLVICLIIIGGLAVASLFGFRTFFTVARDPENAKLFRKFGSPEEIAAQIAAGVGSCLVDTKRVYVTDKFIMQKKSLESFMPYSHVVLAYKKEHSTNGIKDGVFLTVHDVYGDSIDYPFPLSRKKAEEMDRTAAVIGGAAPMCRFGYTGENLKYAKSVKRPIPERS